jgi:hypothetical protein
MKIRHLPKKKVFFSKAKFKFLNIKSYFLSRFFPEASWCLPDGSVEELLQEMFRINESSKFLIAR